MKTQETTLNRFQPWIVCVVALSLNQALTVTSAADILIPSSVKTSAAWSHRTDYDGEELAVVPTLKGARLHCILQRLQAEATPEGLWMTSSFTNAASDHFRVVASQVGRQATGSVNGPEHGMRWSVSLPQNGTVTVEGRVVRFARPKLVEEYSVSMDGVRQDFVVAARPPGSGELALRLAVSGAKVDPAIQGAQLVLDGSRRKIA